MHFSPFSCFSLKLFYLIARVHNINKEKDKMQTFLIFLPLNPCIYQKFFVSLHPINYA